VPQVSALLQVVTVLKVRLHSFATMGCGQYKQKLHVDDAIVDVRTDHQKLPQLLAALENTYRSRAVQVSQGYVLVKTVVSGIFQVVSVALTESVTEETLPLVVAACGIIEFCVTLYNDEAIGEGPPKLNGKDIIQCQQQLGVLMKKVVNAAGKERPAGVPPVDAFSKEAQQIALATLALFKLETYATDCKNAISESGGIEAAVMGLKEKSGLKPEAKDKIMKMLNSYVNQNVGDMQSMAANNGVQVLLTYSRSKDLPNDVKAYCRSVIEAARKQDLMMAMGTAGV